jgi:hypothetical protein
MSLEATTALHSLFPTTNNNNVTYALTRELGVTPATINTEC